MSITVWLPYTGCDLLTYTHTPSQWHDKHLHHCQPTPTFSQMGKSFHGYHPLFPRSQPQLLCKESVSGYLVVAWSDNWILQHLYTIPMNQSHFIQTRDVYGALCMSPAAGVLSLPFQVHCLITCSYLNSLQAKHICFHCNWSWTWEMKMFFNQWLFF